jgi:hypothetical protein
MSLSQQRKRLALESDVFHDKIPNASMISHEFNELFVAWVIYASNNLVTTKGKYKHKHTDDYACDNIY